MATSAIPPGSGSEAGAAAPVALPPAKRRPGRGWYWVSAAAVVAGVAWAVVAFIVIIGQVGSFPRVPDPGTGVLILPRGGYVVYYEGSGASNGAVPAGHIDVTKVSGSAAVGSITRYSGSMTYQFGSREGSAVVVLQIARPGRFLVRVTSSAAPAGGHLAFGPSIAGWIVAAVVPALVLVLAGVGGAITVAILRHTRATRARPPAGYGRQAAAASWPLGAASPPGRRAVAYPPADNAAARLSYLQGAPVDFGQAITQAFSNGFVYQGRASRPAYWWFALFEVILSVGFSALLIPVSIMTGGNANGGAVTFLIVLLVLLPGLYVELVMLALLVRRLHDIDKSGWWVLIGLVPFAGPIVLLVLTLLAGTPGLNRYQPTLLR